MDLSKTFLGIELGSTRIKAVLIDEGYNPVASGGFDWENKLENGIWTYSLDLVREGLQASFRRLADDLKTRRGTELTTVGGMGVSAMMHGYLVFDKDGNQLVPFRTWRNTITAQAAGALTGAFNFNIPQRWSIAHLYQAILNGEEHVPRIARLTTLAGYVHSLLTGENAVGVGEASGMFPIAGNNYNPGFMKIWDSLIADKGFVWKLDDILPKPLAAGERAGTITEEGAKLLDPTGVFRAGVPLCPPEGDAGTGMAATNSVAQRTGNVSAGTSIFAMVVLEKELSKLYEEIDVVTTPGGSPVAMVHCNNCTTDLDAWVRLLGEAMKAVGVSADKPALYDALYHKALEGDSDCGGLLSYNHIAGEHMLGLEEGRPLFVRMPDADFSFPNFARALLFSAIATLKTGMDILANENVRLDKLTGHGGMFKTEGVAQRLMASALDVPVAVMANTAGEGGAWGIALLAAYMAQKQNGETLEDFLEKNVFAGNTGNCVQPNPRDSNGFALFMRRYIDGLAIERAAVEHMRREG
jgi:sugar (pentulose or hexulose) kinase